MDNYILAKLEWLFNKIGISPYTTARVWTVGNFLFWIYTYRNQLFDLHFWTFFVMVSLGLSVYAMCKQTVEPEQRNLLGLENLAKTEYSWLRICVLIALLVSTPALFTHIRLAIYGFYTIVVFVFHQYLIAVNWNPKKKE